MTEERKEDEDIVDLKRGSPEKTEFQEIDVNDDEEKLIPKETREDIIYPYGKPLFLYGEKQYYPALQSQIKFRLILVLLFGILSTAVSILVYYLLRPIGHVFNILHVVIPIAIMSLACFFLILCTCISWCSFKFSTKAEQICKKVGIIKK
jgi:hypothetical protein